MEVKAIQGLSLSNQSAGSLKKSNNASAVQSYAQMDAPMSKSAAEAIKNNSMVSFGEKHKSHKTRNIVAAAALAAAVASCDPIKVESDSWSDSWADAHAWAWSISDCSCNHKPDTIRTVVHDTIPGDTVYLPGDTTYITKIDTLHFKDYPFHIADSIIAHGINNGFEINGPIPSSNNNDVVFLAGSFYNKYDQKLYQMYAVDDEDANNNKMATLITRVTDLYDRKNPKVSYVKSVVTDVPGKGIQFEYSQIPEGKVSSVEAKDGDYLPSPFDYRFMQAGKEIHTNLRNGTNRVIILDKNGDEEWRGDFKKGQLDNTFFFQTFARDDDGNVYYDDDGNPEMIKYDFEQGKMISRKVEWIEYEPGYKKPNLK